MLALKPETILNLKPGIVLHSLPDQNWFHAFSVITGDQFRLNRTSYWVLETISNGIDWAFLRDKFVKNFEVSEKQGEADLWELVKGLHKQKIIRRQGDEKEKTTL